MLVSLCAAILVGFVGISAGCSTKETTGVVIPEYTYEPGGNDGEYLVNVPTYEPDVVTVSPTQP